MSFREFILNALIASLMAFGIISGLRYFFPTYFGGVQKQNETTLVVAQRSRDQVDPITYEVDFADDKPTKEPVATVVQTNNAQFVFSSEGAALTAVSYKRIINGKETLLNVFQSREHEDRAFLLAFPEKTPLYYELVKHESLPDRDHLVYSYTAGKFTVVKEFDVDKVTSRVDLVVSLSGVAYDNPMRVRLLFPSPLLAGLTNNNVRALANDGSKVVIYNDLKLVTTTRMWTSPVTLFGADDKYFIHAMVSDSDGFVSRAYYKFNNIDAVTAYVESQPIKFDKKWNLGFYFGPKTVSQIDLVDTRLEKTLEYGWLSPLARLTLKVMNGIYDYVKNYGLAIILFTILTRLLLLPLTLRSPSSQSQKNEFNKKLQYISQKYKNDPDALNREREQLYASQMMPGMLGGCLPHLVSIPLFFALNRVLSSSIELYKASFLWIPDLASKDPYYLLPLCIFLVMAFSATSGVTGKAAGKNMWSGLSMALIFAAIGSSLPAGLALYLFSASLVSVLENKILARFRRA
jgi:YidC/Oxa1 family membrane protein insertase